MTGVFSLAFYKTYVSQCIILLQNIFIAFSRHNYGKTQLDVALTGKQKSTKYFSKNLLLTTSISKFQQCPSPQDNAGHLQDFYALEWAICTFPIKPGAKQPILRHWVGHLAQPKEFWLL